MGFEYLDHPADLQIHSWGSSLEQSFVSAAQAMLSFMSGGEPEALGSVNYETIELLSVDGGALLHDFLDELLFRFSIGSVAVLFKDMHIRKPWSLSVEVGFVPFDQQHHGQGSEVKAVTWSNLQINCEEPPFDAYIVLDI